MYLTANRLTNALAIVEEQLKLRPDNLDALLNKAYICMRLEAYELASAAVAAVLKKEPDNVRALLDKGAICIQTKAYKEACDKAGAALHWGAYEVTYGGDSGTYIMLTHRDTLAEIDQERAASKKIMEAMGGEDGAAKMDQTFASAIESVRSELFTINPRQSYVDEATMKADADFWKPKAMAPKTAVAATAKPVPATTAKPASR